MKRKITKKILHIALWVLLVFVALDLLMVLLVFTPPVQKLIINKVTHSIEEVTKSKFSIKKIYITPTFKVKAKEIAIQDHHGNNMIYAKKLSGRLNFSKSSLSAIYLKDVVIEKGEFIVREYKGEKQVNLNVWINHFEKSKSSSGFIFCLEDAKLINSRFAVMLDNRREYRTDNVIDYGFFELKNINAEIENFKVEGPEVVCKILQVSLDQYTGFKIKTFSGDFKINSNALTVSSCRFTTEKSKAEMDFAFRYSKFKDYSQFFDKIRFDVDLKSSVIHMDDIACFLPVAKGMHNSIVFNGKAEGPLNALQLKNCYAKYKMSTYIAGDFAIYNLVNIKNSSYDFQLKHSNINLAELSDFYIPGGTIIGLPENIKTLGSASVKGNFVGTFNYFTTDLSLISSIGDIKMFLKTEPDNGRMQFEGYLSSTNFQLGQLIQNTKYFGMINGDVQFEGTSEPFFWGSPFAPSIVANFDAYASQFNLCNYPLNNIEVHGTYEKDLYVGQVSSTDPNASFDFDGTIDLRNELPRYKTTLSVENLVLGNIFKNFHYSIDTLTPKGFDNIILFAQYRPDFTLSFSSLEAEIKGNTLQNFTGFVAMNQIEMHDNEKSAICDWLRLNSLILPGEMRKFIMKGSVVNATLATNYKLNQLVDSMESIAKYYMPAFFQNKPLPISKSIIKSESLVKNHFLSLNVETFDTRNFLDLFVPGLRISRNSTVNLFLGPERKLDTISVEANRIRWKDQFSVAELSLHGRLDTLNAFNLNLHADTLVYYQKKKSLNFKNIDLITQTYNQIIKFNFSWISPDTLNLKNTSFVNGFADISNTQDVKLKFEEVKFYLRNSVWSVIGKNEVHFKKNKIEFDDLILQSRLGEIDIAGTYSTISNENLNIRVENFDVSLINAITSIINIELGGRMSALMTYQSRLDKSTLIGKSYFENFVFNKEKLGTLFVFAEAPVKSSPVFFGGLFVQDSTQKLANIEQYNFMNYGNGRIKVADLRGTFNNNTKELRIKGDIDSVRIGFLSPFLASFSNYVNGVASGQLTFVSKPDTLYFDGVVTVKEAFLGIAPMNTIYKITNQKITFNTAGIQFDKVEVSDRFNNKAIVDGYVNHKNFSTFDVNLNIESNRILAMSRIKKTDSYFYGDAFASGSFRIFGDNKKLSFKGDNLKSLPGTKMGFPISYASTSYEDKGIRFVSLPSPTEKATTKPIESNFEMDFDFIFDVNRDADVRIDLEPVDGILDCKTNGKIRITYNSKTDILNMDGRLDLLSGEFSMSIKNVVPRTFELLEGGSINFVGPIKSSTISLTALLERTASLKDLSPDIDVNKTQVNAYLSLSGDLMNPQPSFSFGFPKLTSEEEKQVFSILDTTNYQNNLLQFFSLVYLGTFYSTTASLTDVSPIDASIEVITRTLSNILLKEIKFVDIGVNVLSSNQYFREYSVITSKPFYKDRLLVKSRFGYAESLTQQTASSNFIGDFSLEYLINEEGNWRLKLFYFNDPTNMNDIYQNFTRPTQGGGVALIYQQEFYHRKGLIECPLDRKKLINQSLK